MENNISASTTNANPQEICENCVEPYVGMPIYLDDSFFKFVSEEIELDCLIEDGNKPEMGTEKPMDCVKDCPLAMAYVPWQKWKETYEPEKGFTVGTIFPCLDLPFLGGATK